MARELSLARGFGIFLFLAVGYLGSGLGFAHLVLAVGGGQPPSARVSVLLAGFVGLLAAARALAPGPRPRLLHLLLAPLPLAALALVAYVVRAAFAGPPGPSAALVVATNLVGLAAVLAAYRLYTSGFYSHRWVAR